MHRLKPGCSPDHLQTLRQIIVQSKPKEPKSLQPARVLQHGWLLPYLLHIDAFLWRRWDHWFETMSAQKIIGSIPVIEWQKNDAALKMLEGSLSHITKYGDWRGWGSWNVFEYFLDWLLFGFGHGRQLQLPEEKDEYRGASERLYQVFNLETLLAFPHDYFGDILAENQHGRESGFFPTPMDVAQLLAQMNFGDEDARSKTVCDPCVGTGRLLLVASNYSYRLYGNDINSTVIKATLVNGYLYAPWLVRPFPFFDSPRQPVRKTIERVHEQRLLLDV